MAFSPALPEWRAESALIWINYDDSEEWVVYHPLSSDVHLLTASARRLWCLLQAQPLATEPLVIALAGELGRQGDPEFETTARETMALMDRAGLIRPSEL